MGHERERERERVSGDCDGDRVPGYTGRGAAQAETGSILYPANTIEKD